METKEHDLESLCLPAPLHILANLPKIATRHPCILSPDWTECPLVSGPRGTIAATPPDCPARAHGFRDARQRKTSIVYFWYPIVCFYLLREPTAIQQGQTIQIAYEVRMREGNLQVHRPHY